MTDKKDDDDDKEWKSSHDRFVDTLERFMAKTEKEMEKQHGFVVEVSAAEMKTHFDKRASFHGEEAFKLSEIDPLAEIGHLLSKLADGSPMLPPPEVVQLLTTKHKVKLENALARQKAFEFAASHMPPGKKIFIMSMSEAHSLEFIPGEREEPFVPEHLLNPRRQMPVGDPRDVGGN